MTEDFGAQTSAGIEYAMAPATNEKEIMEYTPDIRVLEQKRLELLSFAIDDLGIDMAHHAESLIDSFCRLSPPQDPPALLEMITWNHGGRNGGRTRKPGNILLNWKKMVREFSDFVLIGASSIEQHWLIPFAALSIFNKLWSHATIELSKEHATCLFAMWHRCNDEHEIDRDMAFQACNELFSVFHWPALEDGQFSAILHDLA